jgi:Tol biopolymer transport system component
MDRKFQYWFMLVNSFLFVLILLPAPCHGKITRVSVSSTGEQASGHSPRVSDDGRYVVFISDSKILIPPDVNLHGSGDYQWAGTNVFLHDRQTKVTELISYEVAGANKFVDSHAVGRPDVSRDGKYVVWQTQKSLISDDNAVIAGTQTPTYDIYLRNRQTGELRLLSRSNAQVVGNNHSSSPRISPDGWYVVFTSAASNLVPNDTNGKSDIFLYDLTRNNGRIERVTPPNTDGHSSGADVGAWPWVSFSSAAKNIVSSDTNNCYDIFLRWGYENLVVQRVKGWANGNVESNADSGEVDSGGLGHGMAFVSAANNLVPDDNNGVEDIFVAGFSPPPTVKRVSVSSAGEEANNKSSAPSYNGHWIAFSSKASNLVSNDTNNKSDIYVHDLLTNKTNRINRVCYEPDGNSVNPSISIDGRVVAFESNATNLVADDNNGITDVFVYEEDSWLNRHFFYKFKCFFMHIAYPKERE